MLGSGWKGIKNVVMQLHKPMDSFELESSVHLWSSHLKGKEKSLFEREIKELKGFRGE